MSKLKQLFKKGTKGSSTDPSASPLIATSPQDDALSEHAQQPARSAPQPPKSPAIANVAPPPLPPKRTTVNASAAGQAAATASDPRRATARASAPIDDQPAPSGVAARTSVQTPESNQPQNAVAPALPQKLSGFTRSSEGRKYSELTSPRDSGTSPRFTVSREIAKSPRRTSEVNVAKHPARGLVTSQKLVENIGADFSDAKRLPRKAKKAGVPAFTPIAHINKLDELLSTRLKKLGTRPAVYSKALAEINETMAEPYFLTLNTEVIIKLKGLLPKLTKKSPAAIAADIVQPQQIAGQNSPIKVTEENLATKDDTQSSSPLDSTPTSSPEKPSSAHHLPLGSSPEGSSENVKKIIHATTASSAEQTSSDSPSPSLDNFATAHAKASAPTAPVSMDAAQSSTFVQRSPADTGHNNNLAATTLETPAAYPEGAAAAAVPEPPENRVDIDEGRFVDSKFTLVPICDLFNDITTQEILTENNLTNNHRLLVPLQEIINNLKHLEKHFEKGTRLYTSVTTLLEYYTEGCADLVKAKSPEERKKILAAEAYARGDRNEFFIIEPENNKSSGEKGLHLLCRNLRGESVKILDAGQRPVAFHCPDEEGKPGVVGKPDPTTGVHLKSATERAVSNWYQLFNQQHMCAARSAILNVSHVKVDLPPNPVETVIPMVQTFGEHQYIGRVVQMGFAIGGHDLQMAFEALGIFSNWQNALQGDLLSHLTALEKTYQQDKTLLNDPKNWPEELIKHHRLTDADAIKRLPEYFKVLRDLLPIYTPENAIAQCPKILDNIDHYNFSSFNFANLLIDPADIKADNLRLVWVDNADGTRSYRLVIIDADEALNFPATKKENFHYPSIKCITYLMRKQMNRPIDEKFRDEFLSRDPLTWMLDWCQLLSKDDQSYRKLIAEQALTMPDLFEALDVEGKEASTNTSEDNTNTRSRDRGEKRKRSLDIPLKLHPERLFAMLTTLQNLHKALAENPKLTLQELLQIARPETAAYYKKVCHPLLREDNPTNSIFDAYHKISKMAPSFQHAFLESEIIAILTARKDYTYKPHLETFLQYEQLRLGYGLAFLSSLPNKDPEQALAGKVYLDRNGDYYVRVGNIVHKGTLQGTGLDLSALHTKIGDIDFIAKVLAITTKNAHTQLAPPEDGLPCIEELTKRCKFPELGNQSLYDLLKDHNHKADEHFGQATISIEEAVTLLIKRLKFCQYTSDDNAELLHQLDCIGTHFPFIKLPQLTQENSAHSSAIRSKEDILRDTRVMLEAESLIRDDLLLHAAEAALPGAIALLTKTSEDTKFRSANINTANKYGETALHILMHEHRRHAAEMPVADPQEVKTKESDAKPTDSKLIAAVKALLHAPGVQPELLDQKKFSPLMVLIANSDPDTPKLTEEIIKIFREKKVNLNAKTDHGTALDLAIRCNNLGAVIALIKQGAADLVDAPTAVKFALRYQDDENMHAALSSLRKLNPEFDYRYSMARMSTMKPDSTEHPAECLLDGAELGKRYLNKKLWPQLINAEGNINIKRSVGEGTHIVIPIVSVDYELRLMPPNTALEKFKPLAIKNSIYLERKNIKLLQYTVVDAFCNLMSGEISTEKFKEKYPKLIASFAKELNLDTIKPYMQDILDITALRGHTEIYCFLKALPEAPGMEKFSNLIHRACGSIGNPWSELCLLTTPNHETIPIQATNAINGISLLTVLKDPKLREEYLAKLDPYYFALFFFCENLVGQEDGHAAQYKVIKIQTPYGERTAIVNIDNDHGFVPAFNPHLPTKSKLFIKDIMYLLVDQVIKQNLDPRATQALSNMDITDVITYLLSELAKMDASHNKLCPRGEINFTKTASEAIEDPWCADPLPKGIPEPQKDTTTQQRDKALTEEEKLAKMSRVEKVSHSLKSLRKVKHKGYTLIGGLFHEHALAKLAELMQRSKQAIIDKAGMLTGMELFEKTRTKLAREYWKVIIENPKLGPNELFGILTKEHYKRDADKKRAPGKNQDEVTNISNFDVMISHLLGDAASQAISNKHKTTCKFVSIDEAIAACVRAQEEESQLETIIAETSAGDTTKLQALILHSHQEYVINHLSWNSKVLDNPAILKTIEDLEISHEAIKFNGCTALTTHSIEKLLENSPNLKKIDLSGCTGVTRDILKLLSKYCPGVESVILSKTTISAADADLPALTRLELRNCMLLKSLSLNAPTLTHLNLSGCSNLNSITLSATTRNLQDLNIKDCRKLPAKDIEMIQEYSTRSLTRLRHRNNAPFKARTFAQCQLKQGHFKKNPAHTFEVLVQHGKLDLYGLDFEDKDLAKIPKWIERTNAANKALKVADRAPIVINEIDSLGCTRISRMAIPTLVKEVESKKLVFQGPLRAPNTQGRGYEWDTGLTTPVVCFAELPSGDILCIGQRNPITARKLGAAEYTIRSSERTNKDNFDYSLESREKDKFKGTRHRLPEGADVKSIAVRNDGFVLLSIEFDPAIGGSQLLLLDPATHSISTIEVPEATSLAGNLCILNNKTIALHSDSFYIIEIREYSWNVLHKAKGAVGLTPLVKGPNRLVAYCPIEDSKASLCVMDYETGHLVYNRHFNTDVLKVLHFLDKERLLIIDGEIENKKVFGEGDDQEIYSTQPIGIFNISTHEFKIINDRCDITAKQLKGYYAIPSTGYELFFLARGHDPHTLVENGVYADSTENPLISCQGDFLALTDKGALTMTRNLHYILDLSFLTKNHQNYQLSFLEGDKHILKISCPENVIPPMLPLEEGSQPAWTKKMCSRQITGDTLFEMLSAFFEKNAVSISHHKEKIEQRKKLLVTCHDNIITIKGLSDNESDALRSLLKGLLHQPPSPVINPRRFQFQTSAPTTQAVKRRKASICFISDDESALPQEPQDPMASQIK
jgi:hypothetical protein